MISTISVARDAGSTPRKNPTAKMDAGYLVVISRRPRGKGMPYGSRYVVATKVYSQGRDDIFCFGDTVSSTRSWLGQIHIGASGKHHVKCIWTP